MKNILIIDDSALIRRVISDIINGDGRFQVKDVAHDGLEGLNFLLKNRNLYDTVILDINMPKMNGIQLLEELNRAKIKVPVIIVSTLAKEGAVETIKALSLGAFDFVLKPSTYENVKKEDFKLNLLQKLQSAAGIQPKTSSDAGDVSYHQEIEVPKTIRSGFYHRGASNGKVLVALACSTGGPRALQTLIPMLPAKIGASMLIVQHMPEGFTLSLSNRLQEMSIINIKEAAEGDILLENQIYMAKGGYQMRIKSQGKESFVSLTKDPPRGGLRPCADIMYESLLSSAYEKIVCVVLTGMGADATAGIRQLKQTNNIYVIAQSEPTCTVYGMPKAIYEAGLVDEVLPLDQIAGAIVKATGVR